MSSVDDALLRTLLDDDCGLGDLTTDALGIGHAEGRFEFSARQPMCVCGVEEAERLGELCGLRVRCQTRSGAALQSGDPILEAAGAAEGLHRAWKTAQVLIEWSSGIASCAADIVAAASGIRVACTRKHPPGTKRLAVKSIRAGGATMHRLGLAETLLVFPEHRLFLTEAPCDTVSRLAHAEPEKRVVVEVRDITEAVIWAQAGAGVLQLEKFSPAAVRDCRQRLAESGLRPLLAVAGGITAANAADYVAAGAGLLVTSAPFAAPPRDVAVRFFCGNA